LKMAPVCLSEVLSGAIEASRPVMDRVGHEFDAALPDEPIWVNGDSARLTQIVTNLLNNAAKYTDPGGHIWLSLEREDNMAAIRVRDTGIGIPPEMLASVFDLFTQVDRSLDRSQGGLGIGLTLVNRLVATHGGRVSATSEGPGKGSEFTVRLPTIPAPGATESNEMPRAASSRLKQLSVLVVEDHVDGARSLAALLRMMCREVRIAHQGTTGLDLAFEHRPDAIILDIGLPGMNGYEVARHLPAMPETQNAILIAITGYGCENDQQLSYEAGFDRHLVKPVDIMELRRVLETLAVRTHTEVET
jgi:CheY-like chemotaxis protein/anti-sigma regulatory factor (Ser/Thr protein kinase)